MTLDSSISNDRLVLAYIRARGCSVAPQDVSLEFKATWRAAWESLQRLLASGEVDQYRGRYRIKEGK
jgi:predicted transcriptional regulator